MKNLTKILCLVLVLLMTVACFAACGGGDETTAPITAGTEDDSGRNAVKDDVPTDLKFNGKKMVFYARDQADIFKNEFYVEKTTNNTLADAVYYRKATVEQRLGIEIEQITNPGSYSDRETFCAPFRNAVLTKTNDFDACGMNSSYGTGLALEGLYYNLLDLPYINLEKPWWNKTVYEELMLFDTLYYLTGDACVSLIADGSCLFFNKDLFEELYKTQNIDLYKLVEDQKWTIDEMYKLVAGAWIDENSDGIVSDGDTVGFANAALTQGGGTLDSWVPAMGIRVTTKVDGYPTLSFYNEHSVEAFEKLKALYLENPGSLAVNSLDSLLVTSFAMGNQLFHRDMLNAGEKFRNMADHYGVLPLPKFDEAQEDYYSYISNGASMLVVPSTCTETEKVGATLELMAAEGYKQVTPAYFEICLQGKYSNSPEDSAMYDRIIDTFVADFGFSYSRSINNVAFLFRYLNSDFAQQYDSNEDKYETSLETLLDKLDDLSLLAG